MMKRRVAALFMAVVLCAGSLNVSAAGVTTTGDGLSEQQEAVQDEDATPDEDADSAESGDMVAEEEAKDADPIEETGEASAEIAVQAADTEAAEETGDETGEADTVAMIGETCYASLAEAVAAAGTTTTIITLTADQTISGEENEEGVALTIGEGQDIILNLDNYTLTVSSGVIEVSGSLTVEASSEGGKIYNTSDDTGAEQSMIEVHGSFALDSGTLKADSIYGVGCLDGGTAMINGGVIDSAKAAFNADIQGSVTISGASIRGTIVSAEGPVDNLSITGGIYTVDPTKLLTDGYECVTEVSDGVTFYTVQAVYEAEYGGDYYRYLEDAVAAANAAGETYVYITMLRDADADLTVNAGKTLELNLSEYEFSGTIINNGTLHIYNYDYYGDYSGRFSANITNNSDGSLQIQVYESSISGTIENSGDMEIWADGSTVDGSLMNYETGTMDIHDSSGTVNANITNYGALCLDGGVYTGNIVFESAGATIDIGKNGSTNTYFAGKWSVGEGVGEADSVSLNIYYATTYSYSYDNDDGEEVSYSYSYCGCVYFTEKLPEKITVSIYNQFSEDWNDPEAVLSANYELGELDSAMKYSGVSYPYGVIGKLAVTLNLETYAKEYTGSAVTLSADELVVTYGDTVLEPDKDYKVSYSNNKSVGTATVTVKGTGNYAGTQTAQFAITQPVLSSETAGLTISSADKVASNKDVKDGKLTIDTSADVPSSYQSAPVVAYNGQTLKKGTDYSVSYDYAAEESGATTVTVNVTVDFDGANYSGSATTSYRIITSAVNIKSCYVEINGGKALTYGELSDPLVTVKPSKTSDSPLTGSTDYELTYSVKNGKVYEEIDGEPTDAGSYKVTITGVGNYGGSVTKSFTIKQANLSSKNSGYKIADIAAVTYDGSAQTPDVSVVKVTEGSEGEEVVETLTANSDYLVSKYANNVNAGKKASVTITGTGNYTGKLTANFEITAKNLANENEYVGWGTDAKLTAKGTSKTTLTIKDTSILTAGDNYTTLKSGSAYTVVEYGKESSDIPEGEVVIPLTDQDDTINTYHYAKVEGKGNYTGTIYVPYRVYEESVSSLVVTLTDGSSYPYTGSEIEPGFTVKKKGGDDVADYEAYYSNNTNIGTATLTISGVGDYGGTKTVKFSITGKDLTNDAVIEGTEDEEGNVTGAVSRFTVEVANDSVYDGTGQKPDVTVYMNTATADDGSYVSTVVDPSNYTVAYSNNVNASDKAVATVKLKGSSVKLTQNFSISPLSLWEACNDYVVTVTAPDVKKTSKTVVGETRPKVTVKYGKKTLKEGTDYELGEIYGSGNYYWIEVIGRGNFADEYERPWEGYFSYYSVSASSVTIEKISDQTYTGSEIYPDIKVTYKGKTLTEYTDYSCGYINNVDTGKATVVVYFFGEYSGTRKVNFSIVAKSVKTNNVFDLVSSMVEAVTSLF